MFNYLKYSVGLTMKAGQFSLLRKALILCAFIIASSLLSISCDSSTGSEDSGLYEDRIIFMENCCDLYSSNLNGDLQYMTPSNNFFDVTQPRWNSYNTILEKKAYFDSDTNKVFISNFDGSDVVPLNIKIDPEDKNIILQWMPYSNLVLCYYSGKFYKFNLRGEVVGISKRRDNLADVWEDNEKLNSIHFSSNGQKFLYYNQKGIVICGQDLQVLHVYENKSEYPVQFRLFPAFSYSKDKVYYMLHKIKDVNAPSQVVLSSIGLNSNEETQITPDSMHVVEFALSYDDKYAAVLTSENYKKLYIYNIRERAVKYVIMENFNIYYFRFHPTENKLILNVNTDISVMNIDGTEKKVITKNGVLQGISKFRLN